MLNTCFIRSAEEEGTTCAQQMLANKSVDVIDAGAVAIGIQSFYSTLAGAKPVIVGVAPTPTDSVQKNAVIYFGDVTHVLGPLATYASQVLHAKTAALIYPDIAGQIDGAKAISDAMKQAGVKVKAVAFDESNPDLIGPLTSAGASTADMVIPYTDPTGCVNLAKALKAARDNRPQEDRLLAAVPERPGGGRTRRRLPDLDIRNRQLTFGDTTDPDEVPYHKVAAQYSTPADAPDPWNQVAFSQILTTDKFLNELGYGHITSAKILAKAKAFAGPVALGAPQLQCGKYPSAPAVCNDRTQFFQYHGKFVFTKSAGYLQPPS